MPPIRRTPPTPPPVIRPPKPAPPPVIRPPLPPGPIVITPGGPPPPPEPLPTQYQPGMWSDGWVVVRQHEGDLVLDASNFLHKAWPIQQVGASAADIVNQILGVVGLAARATTVPPWPPAMASLSKAQTIRAIGEFMGEITLADLAAQIQVLILNAEQTNTRLKSIEEHLAGAETEQPPTPPAPVETDHWAAAFGLTEEPAGLDVPLETFSPERAALYAVFARSVINGTRTYRTTAIGMLARALALGTESDETGQKYLDLCVKYSVDRDVAIFALLTGLVDPYEGGLGARLESDVSRLAGTVKPETLSDGTVVSRWVPLTFEGAYKRLLPSGSGGGAGQGGA